MTLQIRAFKKLAMSISTMSPNADVLFARWQSAADRTLTDAKAERLKQLEKFGRQRHSWPVWLSILTEEVGEVAKEINASEAGPETCAPAIAASRRGALRAELIQVAAVALAAVQAIDTGEA